MLSMAVVTETLWQWRTVSALYLETDYIHS
jgi:hypothetical protein